MFRTFRDAFKIPDLRQKLVFTLLMLLVIRIGAAIPIPGIDSTELQKAFAGNDLLGLYDAFSGGAFANMTLFAMGIVPYINASIIMNLLTIAIPPLEEMQKEGTEGRKKIAKITRIATVGLALLQGTATSIGLQNIFVKYDFFSVIVAIFAMTAGTAFLMWIGERITESGIGNGISLIIFVNILSRLPAGVKALYNEVTVGNYIAVFAVLAVLFGMVMLVVLIYLGERRIPVQYAKRVQGRKVYGGQSTHIPIRVNMAGVIPVIFASSLLAFPRTIIQLFSLEPANWMTKILNVLNYQQILPGEFPFGIFLYVTLIILFAYFYTAIIFNPFEVANNMKKNGGFVPGIRPGKPTVDHMTTILNRMVLIGGLILSIIASAPIFLAWVTDIKISLGGTSLIIVAGVCIETVKQIESQLVMRHYKGFLNA
ncbi:MAG: preprotein translocase subunit SecY [Vallitaleaceae bacterium]|jgi:preprotein translocase subunit SecY|nr:preprotein translocase subunit SecY [Vallitaleaceae bacterium]